MAETSYAKATYKVYQSTGSGGIWVPYSFDTTANSVKENTDKVFLRPDINTVNGKTFGTFNGTEYTAQPITLVAKDISMGEDAPDAVKGNLQTVIINLNQAITNADNKYLSLDGGTLRGNLKGSVQERQDQVDGPINLIPYCDISDFRTISGQSGKFTNLTIDGVASINNLTVTGTTTTVNAENLEIKDKIITIAKDNDTALTSPAGFIVPKYDGTNTSGLYFDKTGTAYVGDVVLTNGEIDVDANGTTALPLVVRSKNAFDGSDGEIATWDKTNKCLKRSPARITTDFTKAAVDSVLTYGALKNNVLKSIVKDDSTGAYVITNLAGTTVMTTGTAASKNITVSMTSNGSDIPTESAVHQYIWSNSNKVTVSPTQPTGARIGDIWIQTA